MRNLDQHDANRWLYDGVFGPFYIIIKIYIKYERMFIARKKLGVSLLVFEDVIDNAIVLHFVFESKPQTTPASKSTYSCPFYFLK